jgi:hypothetical protein
LDVLLKVLRLAERSCGTRSETAVGYNVPSTLTITKDEDFCARAAATVSACNERGRQSGLDRCTARTRVIAQVAMASLGLAEQRVKESTAVDARHR